METQKNLVYAIANSYEVVKVFWEIPNKDQAKFCQCTSCTVLVKEQQWQKPMQMYTAKYGCFPLFFFIALLYAQLNGIHPTFRDLPSILHWEYVASVYRSKLF